MSDVLISERVNKSRSLSRCSEDADLAWTRFLTYPERSGKFLVDPEEICDHCFPRRPSMTPARILRFLVEYEREGQVLLYRDAAGALYGVVNFAKWQHLKYTPKAKHIPDPPWGNDSKPTVTRLLQDFVQVRKIFPFAETFQESETFPPAVNVAMKEEKRREEKEEKEDHHRHRYLAGDPCGSTPAKQDDDDGVPRGDEGDAESGANGHTSALVRLHEHLGGAVNATHAQRLHRWVDQIGHEGVMLGIDEAAVRSQYGFAYIEQIWRTIQRAGGAERYLAAESARRGGGGGVAARASPRNKAAAEKIGIAQRAHQDFYDPERIRADEDRRKFDAEMLRAIDEGKSANA